MALAVRLGADDEGNAAVGLEANSGALLGLAARGLEEAAHPHAAQLAALCGGGAARGEARAIGPHHGLLEIGGEAPAVDQHAHGAAVGELGHHVATAQLDRVDAELARCQIDEALDEIIGLGLARTPIGVDRHGVGVGTPHVHEDGGDGIDPAHGGGRRLGRAVRTDAREVGAEIGDRRDVEGREAAGSVERQTCPRAVVAALRVAHEILAALGGPSDRPAEPPRRPQHEHPFGVEEVLRAEAAAHVGCAHVDAVERHVEDGLGELLADRVHALAGEHQIEARWHLIVAADRRARLDRRHDNPVVDELELDHVGRRGKRRLRGALVAPLEAVGEVSGDLVPQARCSRRKGSGSVDHGG